MFLPQSDSPISLLRVETLAWHVPSMSDAGRAGPKTTGALGGSFFTCAKGRRDAQASRWQVRQRWDLPLQPLERYSQKQKSHWHQNLAGALPNISGLPRNPCLPSGCVSGMCWLRSAQASCRHWGRRGLPFGTSLGFSLPVIHYRAGRGRCGFWHRLPKPMFVEGWGGPHVSIPAGRLTAHRLNGRCSPGFAIL